MVAAIFLMVICAAAVVAGITMMSASSKARSWPVVPGKIVERSVGPSTTTGASRPGGYFEPRVTYSYVLGNKSYAGHRITLTTNAYDEAQARRVVDKLPEWVDVHYNPSDPSDSILEPSAITMSILLLIGGVLGLLVGAAVLFTSFPKK
jgi:hypothetical protein